MNKAIRGSRLSVFLGENFMDALRHTLAIVVPVWFLLDAGREIYLPFGLGILLIGLTDLPGTVRDKLRTAIWSLCTLAATALVLVAAMSHWWTMQIFWVVASFVLCLFGAGGNRLGLIGTMCLILAIFIYGLAPGDALTFAFWVFLGALWYHGLSVIQVLLFPFRSLRQALFECLEASGALLHAKSTCYNTDVPLAAAYAYTVEAQRILALKQEQVRHLLLSDPKVSRSPRGRGAYWLQNGLAVMELFEQINAIHFDYDHLRNAVSADTLSKLTELIQGLSGATRKLAFGALVRTVPLEKKLSRELEKLDDKIRNMAGCVQQQNEAAGKAVTEVLANAGAIVQLLQCLNKHDKLPEAPPLDVLAFLPQTRFRWSGLRPTLRTYRSQWRFALRIAVLFGLLWLPISVLHFGHYSYWILLTVIVVSRPNFGLSWQRNLQRLWGTLAGLALGVLAWFALGGTFWTWVLSAVFLFGFFWLQRFRYGYAVICISAVVVLLFAGERGISFSLVAERLFDTLIGCGAALVGAYLFPVWERRRLRALLGTLVQQQLDYLHEIGRFTAGNGDLTRMRLARKQTSASVAAYADGIAQALVEPGHRRLDVPLLFLLRELGYRINAVLVGLALEAERGLKSVPEKESSWAISALEESAGLISHSGNIRRQPVSYPVRQAAAGWELLAGLSNKLLCVVAEADRKYPARHR
ncbi:hypothetical protein C7T94_14410 [Pedobacter yulinensis]|uniref:Uncharacterized protein n=1 Tax=Pedobacter yulinensis TaxID=2126353 RepID=A0A2T3HMU0_9SPHI|nr:hypothetical protein C7T94_14410 [Pedobacter yulinensis]